ncbi:MAG: DUF4167 domain-containing protein [Gemmobacter sp.]
MRSSKSRSRSKQNRPRTLGNIINRVFDSSGPEGKVRGTPQQIIEKYQHLARDAQLSNDRVAHENFMQHAEHYTRMLGEAQREMAAEQDQQRRPEGGQQPRRDDRDDGWQPGNGNGGGWQGNRGSQGGGSGQNGNQGQGGQGQGGQGQGGQGQHGQGARDDQRGDRRPDYRPEYRGEGRGEGRGDYRADPPRDALPPPVDVIGFDADGDAGLVETPEARAPRPPQQERSPRPPQQHDRAPRAPQADRTPPPPAEPAPEQAVAEAPGEAALQSPAKTTSTRRPRTPRKPSGDTAGGTPDTPPDSSAGPREAAE